MVWIFRGSQPASPSFISPSSLFSVGVSRDSGEKCGMIADFRDNKVAKSKVVMSIGTHCCPLCVG